MSLELFGLSLLNGLSYGLLLFMLSAGLTLIFGIMRVLNLAHGSFYMLGAYLGYTATCIVGMNFWLTLILVPCAVGMVGMLSEKYLLRRVHARGHLAELLLTYGLALLVLAVVQWIWGKAPVEYRIPAFLQGHLFELWGMSFPRYRALIMGIALFMLLFLIILLRGTSTGLLLQAATQNPRMLESLGYNVPALWAWVFGAGCALAALAGVLGGFAYVTEPAMAQSMGMLLFVVIVIGGMGSLAGALLASVLLGVFQTLAVGVNIRLADLLHMDVVATGSLWNITLSQCAPLLPFILMVLVLLLRPQGLLSVRQERRV